MTRGCKVRDAQSPARLLVVVALLADVFRIGTDEYPFRSLVSRWFSMFRTPLRHGLLRTSELKGNTINSMSLVGFGFDVATTTSRRKTLVRNVNHLKIALPLRLAGRRGRQGWESFDSFAYLETNVYDKSFSHHHHSLDASCAGRCRCGRFSAPAPRSAGCRPRRDRHEVLIGALWAIEAGPVRLHRAPAATTFSSPIDNIDEAARSTAASCG